MLNHYYPFIIIHLYNYFVLTLYKHICCLRGTAPHVMKGKSQAYGFSANTRITTNFEPSTCNYLFWGISD